MAYQANIVPFLVPLKAPVPLKFCVNKPYLVTQLLDFKLDRSERSCSHKDGFVYLNNLYTFSNMNNQ